MKTTKKFLIVEIADNKLLGIHNVPEKDMKKTLKKFAKQNSVSFTKEDVNDGIITDGSYSVQTYILNS